LRSLRVPLIAQLAARKLPMARIRRISIGTILEFERNVDEPLELLANNQPIGRGIAVRVGENFGLRIAEIRDAARIRSLGPSMAGAGQAEPQILTLPRRSESQEQPSLG